MEVRLWFEDKGPSFPAPFIVIMRKKKKGKDSCPSFPRRQNLGGDILPLSLTSLLVKFMGVWGPVPVL